MKSMKLATEPSSSQDKSGKPNDYEVEDAANTLMRAEKIKQDKRLMPHVHRHLKGKMKAIRSIADLRQAAKESQMPDDDEEKGE